MKNLRYLERMLCKKFLSWAFLSCLVYGQGIASNGANNPAVTSVTEKSKAPENKVEKEMKIETTLIILKPDCIEKKLQGEVIRRFNEQKFDIVACKMMRLTEPLLREHYAHLVNLPFFPEILSFMQSEPVIVLALRGENAIAKVRELLGPTDSTIAPKGTIRGDFGTDKMRNIAHASDSEENAKKELGRFFKTEELFF